MTRRLGMGDAQRGRARVALVVVTLTTLGLLLGLSPGGPLSTVLAAVNGTPTATETETTTPPAATTPTPETVAKIQLINPSPYVTPVIVSNKADQDTSYHLVAWVSNPNSVTKPIVEFRITRASDNAMTSTILGTRIGDTDTWHAFWPVNEPAGNYNVTAQLFHGDPTPGTPQETDTQAVTVNNSRESVELTYPSNVGTLGTFDPVGPATRGFVVDATLSADATGAEVFYGTSPPGTEQNWRHCSIQETVFFSAPGNIRVGCTTATGVDENDITGVAIVATGTDPFQPGPPPTCDPSEVIPDAPPQCPTVDSGDAHRVTSYSQTPTAVSVAPSSSDPQPNNCQVLTATVTDQVQRPIWRTNVDVHAVGPADNLQFGRVTNTTRDWQPADAPGSHDSTEPTHNCGGMGTPPAQAEHNRPGQNDEKHIETKPANETQGGADTSGQFTFALRSSEPGTTNVEAWNDLADNTAANPTASDNDVRDTGEPGGTATITWAGPTATQSASATRSPTTSPTSSPTTSPSATRSPTTSPSATRSPTTSPTASRSPSATATRAPASRTITLESSSTSVVFGRGVVFSGAVDSTDPACESAQTVRIEQQQAGAPGFTQIGTVTTDAAGGFSFAYEPAANATYRAVVDASAGCQAATSSTRTVLVRVRVGLRPTDRRVPKGAKVKLKVTVAPCGAHAGTRVELERSTGRGFKDVGDKRLNSRCKATFKERIKKTSRFRARWPSQDADHESGVSSSERVRATRPPRALP